MEERQRKKKRIGLTVAIIVFLLLAIIMISVQITEITVTGNERYTKQQIIDLILPERQDRNTAYCYYKSCFKPREKIPFVEDYKIVFNGLTKIEIIIYEKSVVGYVSYMSSYMYFDKDGIIVESANTRLDGIPWITGLQFGQIVLYKPLPVEYPDIFGEIMNLTQILSIYQIEVDEIKYNSSGEAVLYLDKIEVVMGSNTELNGKVGALNDVLPQLKGRSGTLYLDNYSETGGNGMYRFKPREST